MRRLALLALLASCSHVTAKDKEMALVHQNIAQESLSAGDPRTSLAEVEKALTLDPTNAEIHNLHGLLLHLSFNKPDDAIVAYRQAITLRPDYSQAKVNLAAAYTAVDRCKDAIPVLEEARRDLLYREPYLVENNLGWCKFKLGDAESGLSHLQAAVNMNRKFCLGFRNLATIDDSLGRTTDEREALGRYIQACPDVPDAYYQMGVFLLKQSDSAGARSAFQTCKAKAKEGDLADECGKQAGMIPEGS